MSFSKIEETPEINEENLKVIDKDDVEPSPSIIKNLGDFPIFGWWAVFILVLSEFCILSQMSNITFMVYGKLEPKITSCGEHDFTGMPKDQVCTTLAKILENETCQVEKSIQFNSVANEFDYYCSSIQDVKNSISAQMIGVLVGAIIFGQLSDLFGRRKIMIVCTIGIAIFDFGASYSTGLTMFTVLQTITLAFSGGLNSVGNVYVIENLPKNLRAMATLLINFTPNYILCAIIAYFAWDWRLLLRVYGIVAVLAFCLTTFVAVESPRWLVHVGKLTEAKKTFEHIERKNKTETAERQAILDVLIQKEVDAQENRKSSQKYSYWHLFYTLKMIQHTLVLSLTMLCVSMVNYALMFDMGVLPGSIYRNNIMLGVIRYSFNIASSIVDMKFPWAGRKFITRWSLIPVVVSLTVAFLIRYLELDFPAWVSIVFVLIGAAMTSQMFSVVIVVTNELFPTPVRNIAASFQQIFSRFGAVLSPHVSRVSSMIWQPSPYLFMALVMLAALIGFEIAIPESKGSPMSDHMPPKEESVLHLIRQRKNKTDKNEVNVPLAP
uniref:Major facilitator superfamily (MFS) profile domain-containing protein n=2 Tax=Panagrolaimus sp. JU765 TaxID=591449 RepID=A0AC34R554_9BILA